MARCLGIKFQALDAAGAPLALGKVYTYSPGGTTPKATFSDAALTVENDNPVVLDAGGQADIYLNGVTKFVVKTAAGVTVRTVDKVGAIASSVDTTTAVDLEVLGYATVGDDLNVTAGGVRVDGSVEVTGDLTVHDSPYFTIRGSLTITGAVSTDASLKGVAKVDVYDYIQFTTPVAVGTNNSIYLDSADNKIHLKDNSGVKQDLY